MDIENLKEKTVKELREIAKAFKIKNYFNLKKEELLSAFLELKNEDEDGSNSNADFGNESEKNLNNVEKTAESYNVDNNKSKPESKEDTTNENEENESSSNNLKGMDENKEETSDKNESKENDKNTEESQGKKSGDDKNYLNVDGILDKPEGSSYGFMRFSNFLPSDKDVYVSPQLIKKYSLRSGDKIKGLARPPKGHNADNYGALVFIDTVNESPVEENKKRPLFEKLTPVFPQERLNLETKNADLSMRLINFISPIGKGQRGLIVASPKAGKTILLKKIAKTIEETHPECHMMVLLVDERPEEVTDMKRSINGEVIYSTFDEKPENHVKVTEMVLDRAKRMAENKKDVVILLDSITRLARSYNLVIPSSGRTLSGGLDPSCLHKPKRFFGAARNIEEGGSITILATALVETGSKMDDVIFEEFKGTGNMELHLDRKLSEKRIFPAIDLNKSGTRREDLLLEQDELEAVYRIRRALSNSDTQETAEKIIQIIVNTRNNADFIKLIQRNIK